MICWNCGQSENLPARPGRSDTCPNCNKNLRCCYNCGFFDKTAHHQCREPQADWVKNKDAANFCDYFEPKSADNLHASGRKKLSKEDAAKKWDELFKKK